MQRILVAMILCGFAALSLNSCRPKNGITQEELVLWTQELVDAVAAGNQTPWKKYFAEDCIYFDEKGRSMDKAALIAGLTPLPKGSSGSITIGNAQSRIEGNVAILSYDLNEKETIYGQIMTARYHETDTWIRRNGDWQIVAAQVLRYYEDPAPGKVEPAKYSQYLGTYELAPTVQLMITEDGKQLYRQRGDRPKEALIPEAADIFFRAGVEGRILFRAGAGGKVDTLIDRRNNEDVVWRKVK
jgi:hypothetical protein